MSTVSFLVRMEGQSPAAVGREPSAYGMLARVNSLNIFEGHTKSVNSVVFSPNSNSLISTGDDGGCLWDVNTG